MKLFTSAIDKHLFEQYPLGSDLEKQKVVAKIFNPYGRGTWYLLNSDPEDPDYIWAIVDMFEIETGSVSRNELESIRIQIGPYKFPLERDMSFKPVNASELFENILKGNVYKCGGMTYKRGGVPTPGDWVVYDPQTGKIIDEKKSYVAAKKSYNNLWKTGKYDELGMKSKSEFAKGGSIGPFKTVKDLIINPSYPENRLKKLKSEIDDVAEGKIRDKFIMNLSGHAKYDLSNYNSKEHVIDRALIHIIKMDLTQDHEMSFRTLNYSHNDLEKWANQAVKNMFVVASPDKDVFLDVHYKEGGTIDSPQSLKGRYLNIYSAGVDEPDAVKITDIGVSPETYSHRTVSIFVGEDMVPYQVPLEKFNEFMKNGIKVRMPDAKEPVFIELVKSAKFERGGTISYSGGKFTEKAKVKDGDDIYNIILSRGSVKEIGSNSFISVEKVEDMPYTMTISHIPDTILPAINLALGLVKQSVEDNKGLKSESTFPARGKQYTVGAGYSPEHQNWYIKLSDDEKSTSGYTQTISRLPVKLLDKIISMFSHLTEYIEEGGPGI
jgi:hypothetical protein